MSKLLKYKSPYDLLSKIPYLSLVTLIVLPTTDFHYNSEEIPRNSRFQKLS